MKLGFVVPRYGADVIGGSETAARMLAERLVAEKGFAVEVFTTCGREISWRDEYSPGTSLENGVVVHRFSSIPRSEDFATFPENPVRHPLDLATREACLVWLEKQGPVCHELLDAAKESNCDLVAFYPYLYWPTVHGVRLLNGRAVLHPAAHDEREIRLPIFEDLFNEARALVYHTDSERELVLSLFRVGEKPQIVLGLGIEESAPDREQACADLGFDLSEVPYICCVGRVDRPKGTTLLAEMFIEYKLRHPGPLKLVFVGSVVDEPPFSPDIVLAGVVSEGSKWAILKHALALVSPSANESFSLAVMEAWHAGIAVVVNGACRATAEHCKRSGGGFVFGGEGSTDAFVDFEAALSKVVAGEVSEMAEAGRRYADSRYSWPVVLDRYVRFLSRMIKTS